jgi:hypothetical protein
MKIDQSLQVYILFIGLIFVSTSVLSHNKDVQKCAGIDDSLKRLSCYDLLFIKSQSLEMIEEEEQKNQHDFGLEAQQENPSIRAKIISVNKKGNYKIYITLDNEQVWRSVKDFYDRTPLKKDQTVFISKGFLSGYVMKVEGKKVSLRVRRAQ